MLIKNLPVRKWKVTFVIRIGSFDPKGRRSKGGLIISFIVNAQYSKVGLPLLALLVEKLIHSVHSDILQVLNFAHIVFSPVALIHVF